MSEPQGVVAAQGTTPDGVAWSMRYRPEGWGGRHHIALFLNGTLSDEGSGLDLPGTTEIGFCGGLKPGTGCYFLYGLVTARIERVRAEGRSQQQWSEAATSALPGATTEDGYPLRSFVLVRPPVDDVTALVGLDQAGRVVQRIPLL